MINRNNSYNPLLWSEFPEILIYEWNDISRNLRTQEQEQPREVCPNFRKFQVLPGISDLK